MELKKGDKLIFEPAEVGGVLSNDPDGFGVIVQLRLCDNIGLTVSKTQLKNARKILGLLGDEGLEAEVGMKLWEPRVGYGEIKSVNWSSAGLPVSVYWDVGIHCCITADGKHSKAFNRTVYVVEMPEEEKGWAVYWKAMVGDGRGYDEPCVFHEKVTEGVAENLFPTRLIHWIPERKE